MSDKSLAGKRVLITGGTSGLGKSLANQIKQYADSVTIIGRKKIAPEEDKLKFFACDLADFSSINNVIDQFLAKDLSFDILINNAGILSPPKYTETVDGYELSYQVNFLSHVLLTRLLINQNLLDNPVVINMTSPICKLGTLRTNDMSLKSYNILQAYADSKLYMVLFSELLASEGIRGFAFNPGTFSSAIFRSQKHWFHFIYKIAAPFMVSSDNVAKKLINILARNTYNAGKMIGKNGSETPISKFGESEKVEFWNRISQQLGGYV